MHELKEEIMLISRKPIPDEGSGVTGGDPSLIPRMTRERKAPAWLKDFVTDNL